MAAENDNSRQVVVTGLGIISPVGIGREPFWESLASGKSGISQVEMFDCSILPGGVAGLEKAGMGLREARL